MPGKKFRKVNRILDSQPRIAFIPADQLIPWLIILATSYYLFRVFFGFHWIWVVTIATWAMSSWWILTAKGSWRYLGKFVPVPNWSRGRALYQSLLEENGKKDQDRRKKSRNR